MQNARLTYLETQLLTATPQRLRLMLIEGALQFAHLTLQQWEAGNNEEAYESLLRCRGIVSELMSAVRPDGSDVAKRVLAVYLFIFQALTEAQVRRDARKLGDAIQILEIERDTWRELCEKMPEAPQPEPGASHEPKEITASGVIPMVSPSPSSPSTGSFSLDA